MYRLIYAIISLFCSQVYAFDAKSLYESSAPVQNQTEQARQDLTPDLLRNVILKVVGNSSVVKSHDLTPLIERSAEFVQQFQYRRISPINEDLTQPDSLELVVSFDQSRLNQALTGQGLPIWQGARPQILFWLALNRGSQAYILSSENNQQPIFSALQHAAEQRGISIVTPLMDLQDLQSVTVFDIQNMDIEKITSASARYGNKVIVVADAKQKANQSVAIKWQWLINGQHQLFYSEQNTQLAVMDGVDKLTNLLASQLSQVVRSQYGIENKLAVENVNSYSDYSRLLEYLTNLHNVTAVKVLSLAENTLEFTVEVKGDSALFSRTVLFEHVIEEVPMHDDSSIMRYRLLP